MLKTRLESQFSGSEIVINNTLNQSIDDVQDLLEAPGFNALIAELSTKSAALRGYMAIIKRPKQVVSTSVTGMDPIGLAKSNREYTLRFVGKFARNQPFMLIFVIHPWFSSGPLHQNFGGYTDRFCQEFAAQAFVSYDHDNTPYDGMPISTAMRLLSAITFINTWPQTSSQGQPPLNRIYLNTRAVHRLVPSDFAELEAKLGTDVIIKEI